MLDEKAEKNETEIKEDIKARFIQTAHIMWGKDEKDLTENEVYQTLANVIRQYISNNWIQTNKTYTEHQEKQMYYFSVEFLLGRLMNRNLINLGIHDACVDALKDLGLKLDTVLAQEPDAGLGNGGLGRLAACFIDSMAAMGLPGHGCGIRYKYGLFEQRIIEKNQVEVPDHWLKNGFAWEYRKTDKTIDVKFGGNAYVASQPDGSLKAIHENYTSVMAVPYDVPIAGYKNKTVNTLRLWNAEVNKDFSDYGYLSKEQIEARREYAHAVEQITKYLYPDDSSYEGKKLRLIQEYFFVSAGVQSVVRRYKKCGLPMTRLAEKVGIHINDTHPAVAVAELMRMLIDEEELAWEDAWKITVDTMAYTNHTIMPEALEKWPIDMFKELLPRIYMIIEEINRRLLEDVRRRYPDNEYYVRECSILQDGQVHMARLAVVGSHSVNGVAKIHSDILKSHTMRAFHEYYPGKFNNKTNGITHRRWLIGANPELAHLLDETISDQWRSRPERLIDFSGHVKDAAVLEQLGKIKYLHKDKLAKFIKKQYDIKIDPHSIFDVQIKRIHSYKRQLMNIFHVMYLYNLLKNNPKLEILPHTFIFGGKAAPGYYVAKETIRLINSVAALVNNDKTLRGKLKVVFIENYGVSLGEIIFPAADVSEQISTASKEASGTGNMKFMMNGAITLGTLDGANVEIHDAVGDDHCVIFGLKAEEVLAYYANGQYSAWDEYQSNKHVKQVLDQLVSPEYFAGTGADTFQHLQNYIFNSNDEFFILKDFCAYAKAHREIENRYKNQDSWLVSSAVNIAHSGKFSSDRTIGEYARDIWNIKPVTIR